MAVEEPLVEVVPAESGEAGGDGLEGVPAGVVGTKVFRDYD